MWKSFINYIKQISLNQNSNLIFYLTPDYFFSFFY